MKKFKRKFMYKIQTQFNGPIMAFQLMMNIFHLFSSVAGFLMVAGIRARNKQKKDELHSLEEVKSWDLDLKVELISTAGWSLNQRAWVFYRLESSNANTGEVDVDYFFKDSAARRELRNLNRLFRGISRKGNPIFDAFLTELNAAFPHFVNASPLSQWEDSFFERATVLYNQIPKEERYTVALAYFYARGEILPFWVPKCIENMAAEKKMYAQFAEEEKEMMKDVDPEWIAAEEQERMQQKERERLLREGRQYAVRSQFGIRNATDNFDFIAQNFESDQALMMLEPIRGDETLELVYTDDDFKTVHVLKKASIAEDTVSTRQEKKNKEALWTNRWALWQVEEFDELPKPENFSV